MTEDVPPGSTPDTLPRGLFLRVTSPPWEHDPQIHAPRILLPANRVVRPHMLRQGRFAKVSGS